MRQVVAVSAPATGDSYGCGHPAGNEQGPAATTESACAKRRCPYIPAAFCRDAGSAGHGATRGGATGTVAASRFRVRDRSPPAVAETGAPAGCSRQPAARRGTPGKARKQERNGKKRKRKKKKNNNKHGKQKITSEKTFRDTSQTGRVTGDAPAWPAFLPAGVSLPGVFARADRRPPPPALYHLFLLP